MAHLLAVVDAGHTAQQEEMTRHGSTEMDDGLVIIDVLLHTSLLSIRLSVPVVSKQYEVVDVFQQFELIFGVLGLIAVLV